MYFSMYGNPTAQAYLSNDIKDAYKSLTGNPTKWYEYYDIQITTDSRHRNSYYSHYLWIDSNKKVRQSPIIYSNDKVELGRRTGFLGFGFDPLLELSINNSTPVPDDYQALFDSVIQR